MSQPIWMALFAMLVGAALTFAGYRFFRVLMAFWGFFIGLIAGGEVARAILGTGFFGNTAGIATGLIVGLIFAGLAYFLYKAAIVILGASIGYSLGVGFMSAIGFNSQILLWAVGVSFAVMLGLITMMLNVARTFIVLLTAAGGASALLAGVLLLLGRIPLSDLSNGVIGVVVNESGFWFLAWVVLAAVGVLVQLRNAHEYELASY